MNCNTATSNRLMPEGDAAKKIGCSSRAMERWRSTGNGPPYVRIGLRRIAYREADIDAWIVSRTFSSLAAEYAESQKSEAA